MKLKIFVGVALALFIFLVGTILVVGFFESGKYYPPIASQNNPPDINLINNTAKSKGNQLPDVSTMPVDNKTTASNTQNTVTTQQNTTAQNTPVVQPTQQPQPTPQPMPMRRTRAS
jgi:cytoskeletal protein RodZ